MVKLQNYPSVVEAEVSAAQEAAVRVFEKVLEVSGESSAALCRLVVDASEAGSVIGKGGKTVEKLRRESGAKIRVLLGDHLPIGISPPHEVIEIEGDPLAVKKALLGVCGQLQECPQAENPSIKDSKPLESTSQSSVHSFRVDPHHRQTPLSVVTTSYSPAVVGKLSFEADRLPILDLKMQQEEVVFKILCSNDRVGGVIGRGGSIVKVLQEESGANINFAPPVTNCNERLITISSKEDMESRYSPAQRAVVLVFSRSVEAGAERGPETGLNKGPTVSARLVVPSNQLGCLLGKGGVIISEMRKTTEASIYIYKGDQVPKCCAQDDEVVEISGHFANTQDALYHVTSRLRNYLFTSKAANNSVTGTGNITSDTSNHGRARDMTPVGLRQYSGTSQLVNVQATLRQGLDPLFRPHMTDHSVSSGLGTSETAGGNPRNFATHGRGFASANVGAERGSTHRPPVITNTTVEVLVPESAISSVYGENGSNLTRIKQISGAKVMVHEAHPGMRHRTVVISGTPDETQAAQSLLHAFMLTGSS